MLRDCLEIDGNFLLMGFSTYFSILGESGPDCKCHAPVTQIPEPLSPTTGRGNIIRMSESALSPTVPVRASTVILIRDLNGPFQVYLLKRSSQSGFMPGNYVFPGGTVDPEDMSLDFWKEHVDMDPGQAKRHFGRGLNMEDAIAHGIAAVRETFEKCSISRIEI